MTRSIWVLAAAGALLGAPAVAQSRPGVTPLAVGQEAPSFSLPAATRDGVLPGMAKLEDFRGQTVVLAFFYKARTGG